MQNVIIAIHLMVVVALVALILYQKSEGGALGIGSSGFLTGRGQANALTRATSILGTIFFITSIALTVLPAWQRRSEGGDDWTKAIDQKIELKEIPSQQQTPGAPPPADGKDSIFDQLQRAQEQRQKGAPPAAPKVEAPKVEAPKVEAPKTQEPRTELPRTEPPAAEPPKAAAPAEPAPQPESKAPEPKAPEPAASAPAAPEVVAPAAPAASAPAPSAPVEAAPSPAPAPQEASPAASEKPVEAPPASPPPVIWKSPTQ